MRLTSDAIAGLTQLLSARVRGYARAEEYVAVAQNALEAGFDTPSTLKLAIEEPPFFTPDLDRVFVRMLSECGIREPDSASVLIRHAQIVAADIVSGALPPIAGATAIGEIFFDGTLPGFSSWIIIAEGLWCEYCRETATEGHATFEAAIVAEAGRLLLEREP